MPRRKQDCPKRMKCKYYMCTTVHSFEESFDFSRRALVFLLADVSDSWVSDSSARVKETKEASYDTDEGGFLLVFSLHHAGAVLLFCVCFCLCYTTPRQEIPNTRLKREGWVFVFINSKVHEILFLRCVRLIMLPDVNRAARSVQLVYPS